VLPAEQHLRDITNRNVENGDELPFTYVATETRELMGAVGVQPALQDLIGRTRSCWKFCGRTSKQQNLEDLEPLLFSKDVPAGQAAVTANPTHAPFDKGLTAREDGRDGTCHVSMS